jgi:hypothetical protein
MMDSRKQLMVIFGVAIGALVTYAALRAFLENDEARIRRIIYAAALAVERQDTARYGSFVSEGYQDAYGHDKAKLLREAVWLFQEYRPVKIDFKRVRIHVENKEATTEIDLKIYFRRGNDTHTYYDAGEFKVLFHRENKQWKVREIEFQDVRELFFIPNVA